MAIETSWLIGSVSIPETSIQVDGNPFTFSAGHYYLWHPIAALSMVDMLHQAYADAGLGGNTSVYVAKDRKVRIANEPGWGAALEWPAPLRELFGFDDDLPVSDDIKIAPEISPLLWSAGKPHSPQESPFGARGRKVYDTRFGTSPDGTQVADSHHTQIIQSMTWGHVAYTRFQTEVEGKGGEYVTFFDRVLTKAEKFFLYAFVQESLTVDDTPVDWPTGTNRLGPYGYRPTRGAVTYDFQRSAGHQNTGRFNQVSLDCLIVPEWGES